MREKLVRDKIPELILDQDGELISRTLGEVEFKIALRRKLQEEAVEACYAADKGELIEELADVQTVLDELLRVNGFTKEDLVAQQARKDREKGKFDRRIAVTFYGES